MIYNAVDARRTVDEVETRKRDSESPEAIKALCKAQERETLKKWHDWIEHKALQGERSLSIPDTNSSKPWDFFDLNKAPKESSSLSFSEKISLRILKNNVHGNRYRAHMKILVAWLSDENNLREHIKLVISQLRKEGFSVVLKVEFCDSGDWHCTGPLLTNLFIDW